MQKNLFDLHPEEVEKPFDYGDHLIGTDPNGNPQQGYVCAFGIKWLILSAIPRCGTYSSGRESGDHYKLSSTAILWATAKRSEGTHKPQQRVSEYGQ